MILDAYSMTVLSLFVWREARSLDFLAKVGVARVALNRFDGEVSAEAIGNAVAVVPHATYYPLFSAFDYGKPLASAWPTGEEITFREAWLAATEAASNVSKDPTDGADAFYRPGDGEPVWSVLVTGRVEIGGLVFGKLIGQ